MHPLDRPVWNALTSRQAHLALGEKERFLRFPADIEPFGATRDNSPEQLAGLAELTPLDGHVALAEVATLPAPPGFISMILAAIHQMTAPKIGPPDDDLEVLSLSDADAPEMRALAELTQPGPFHARTHQLGGFVGVRDNGRLIAMAGERLRVPGFTEISAVCTHPDARGRGLAGALMRRVAAGIVARGEELFLHVYPHNKSAIALYEKLGFRHRADIQLNVLRRLQAPSVS
ncbi:MAG TPA: GNAT family N-acetyltransferase [Rhizomicrobium sp.]|nr:GNAT family N-acetyltransferase [Rhizomicrobium sp.]